MLCSKLSETLGQPKRQALANCYSPKSRQSQSDSEIMVFTAFDSELLYNLDHVLRLNHPFTDAPISSATSPYRLKSCRVDPPVSRSLK